VPEVSTIVLFSVHSSDSTIACQRGSEQYNAMRARHSDSAPTRQLYLLKVQSAVIVSLLVQRHALNVRVSMLVKVHGSLHEHHALALRQNQETFNLAFCKGKSANADATMEWNIASKASLNFVISFSASSSKSRVHTA
jgi:hypothetical protein